MRRACSVSGTRSSPWRERAQAETARPRRARGLNWNRRGSDELIGDLGAALGSIPVARHQAMSRDGGKYDLTVLRQHHVLAVDQRPRLCGAHQALSRAWREAQTQL